MVQGVLDLVHGLLVWSLGLVPGSLGLVSGSLGLPNLGPWVLRIGYLVPRWGPGGVLRYLDFQG